MWLKLKSKNIIHVLRVHNITTKITNPGGNQIQTRASGGPP